MGSPEGKILAIDIVSQDRLKLFKKIMNFDVNKKKRFYGPISHPMGLYPKTKLKLCPTTF